MKTELFTVSKIFTESIYRIPDYQRGYSWDEDQLRDFWLDLEQLHGDGRHYTGVLTLEDVQEKDWSAWEDDKWIIKARRYRPYYVVDGQQRLTTVIILLQVILERGLGDLNFTPAVDVRRKYIFDSKPEDSARSYIFGYEKDNPSYEFLKKSIFLEQSDVHMPDQDTIYTKNLLAAKKFFEERTKDLSDKEVQRLFTKVTQQLVFNVYEISSDIDVFVTFETMNNRGKLLSTLELLKNRLIYLSTKIETPTGREGILRRVINDAWKAAYHYLGKNDDRPLDDDEFLQTYLSLYYCAELVKIPSLAEDGRERSMRNFALAMESFNRFLLSVLFSPKRLMPGYTDSGSRGVAPRSRRSAGKQGSSTDREALPPLTHKFISDFAGNLKASVETYFKLCNPGESSYSDQEKIGLERLGRLNGFAPSGLVLAIFRLEKRADKRVRALEVIERANFFQSIRVTYNYGRRFGFFSDQLVDYVSGRLSIDDLITYYENFTTEVFKETSFYEVLVDWVKTGHSYYGWRSIKYFLYEYEMHLQQRSGSGRQKLDWAVFSSEDYKGDYETIEHIYPQRAKDAYWTDRFVNFSPSQRRQLRNSLGNLLPLARPRNSSLGNKSFIEKRDAEKGYRYGSYSENEVALLDEWGPEQIVERGIHLLGFLERRWKIVIGDEYAKAGALGLQFMRRRPVK